MPTEHFKSKEAYRKNLAYRHMHGIPMTAKEVCVKGEGCHKVDHKDSSPQRKRIDAAQKRKVAKRGTAMKGRSNEGKREHGKRVTRKRGRGK